MKPRIIFAMVGMGVLLLVSPVVLAQQEEKGTPAKAAAPAAYDFRALIEKLYDAWSDLNPAKAAPFYAKDADLTFFDIAPLKYTGWAQYSDGVPKAFSAYSSGKFMLGKDFRAHQYGNHAWATATWSAELLKKDGTKEHAEGRYTVVLEKRGNDWLVIHEHMSVPAPPPPSAK